jgi:hypothetical protein
MRKKLVLILITMLFVMVSWSPIEDSTSTVFDMVQLRTIDVSGMTYLVSYGENGNTGVSVNNVTLDSLQCLYYKKLLNE